MDNLNNIPVVKGHTRELILYNIENYPNPQMFPEQISSSQCHSNSKHIFIDFQ